MQHSPRKFWEVWGRSDALYNRWAAAHGVNNYRLFVLYVLDNHPGATQKAIADHAGLPKQTVNTVVRALRDEGYVTLSPASGDRREKNASLTPAGQTYAAARKIHEERVAAVMESLNQHVVYHAPTLPDDVTAWAENQWSEAGGSGTPPGLVDGKLSEAGLYKLLSQMRTGNPNWFVQVASATDAGLLRELVIMQAFQLELTRKNTDLLDRLTFIASLDYLTRMEGTTGKEMDDLYTRMVGAQQ